MIASTLRTCLCGCERDQSWVPINDASHSPNFSRAGLSCHSAWLTRWDRARSDSKAAVCALAKSWSTMFNVASSLRRKDRLSKFIEPTEEFSVDIPRKRREVFACIWKPICGSQTPLFRLSVPKRATSDGAVARPVRCWKYFDSYGARYARSIELRLDP